MSGIVAIQEFIRAAKAYHGEDAIVAITVTQDFLDRLDHEAAMVGMVVDHSLSKTDRKILGVSILPPKP